MDLLGFLSSCVIFERRKCVAPVKVFLKTGSKFLTTIAHNQVRKLKSRAAVKIQYYNRQKSQSKLIFQINITEPNIPITLCKSGNKIRRVKACPLTYSSDWVSQSLSWND